MSVGTIGASGAVLAICGFRIFIPNDNLYVMGLVPVKAKWLVLMYAGVELFREPSKTAPAIPFAHVAHLGGALAGFLYGIFLEQKIYQQVALIFVTRLSRPLSSPVASQYLLQLNKYLSTGR